MSHIGIRHRIQMRVRGRRTRACAESFTFRPFLSQWPHFWLADLNLRQKMPNWQEFFVTPLLGDSKAPHQLWCLRRDQHMGQQSKNLVDDVLHDAKGIKTHVRAPYDAKLTWTGSWMGDYLSCWWCWSSNITPVAQGSAYTQRSQSA